MMTAMASGKMPGMPGLPGMGGGQKRQQPKAKKKSARGVSGNPAKRNAAASGAGRRRPGRRVRRAAEHGSGRAAEGDGRLPAAARADASGSASSPSQRPVDAACSAADRLHLRGVVLPDGEHRDLWVVDGLIRTEPVAGRRSRWSSGGWICCRAWSTRTATSGWSRTARCPTSGPRSRRWPSGPPGRCCCGTPAARPTPAGSTTATTCRGSSGPGGTSPAPSATCATTATRSSPTSWSPRSSGRPRAATAG